ncbi:MAG: glycosyltransferase family 9 protein [Candidatus Acidiferrales bacterium]
MDELIAVQTPWGVDFPRWRKYNPFSGAWLKFAGTVLRLRRESFDVALCAKADIRDNFFVWLSGARRRVGYGFYGGSCFLTDVAMPDLDHPHYSSRWLRLLESLGKPALDPRTRLSLDLAEQQFADEYLAERGVKNGDFVIGIHPGARVRTRQWGGENFRAVGERLAAQFAVKILWFGEPNGSTAAELPESFVSVSLPLRQFMAVLSHCSLLICNDSGPLHIAEALAVPVVAVFGPNKPEWFGPLGRQSRTVIRDGFWCRPCGDRCIFDQPYCLKTVSVVQVFQSALDCLEQANSQWLEEDSMAGAHSRSYKYSGLKKELA